VPPPISCDILPGAGALFDENIFRVDAITFNVIVRIFGMAFGFYGKKECNAKYKLLNRQTTPSRLEEVKAEVMFGS